MTERTHRTLWIAFYARLPGERTFSRDCAEFEIETPADDLGAGEPLQRARALAPPPAPTRRREKEAKAVAEICVVRDLNDTADSILLAPLLQQTDLEDVMSHPRYLSGNDRRPGTYGSGAKSNKIDDILLSPALWAMVCAVGVERRGVWAPRTVPEIGSVVEAASDHAAVWGGSSVAICIGVDLGGTKIEGIVMDERSYVIVRERVVMPQGDYRVPLEAIAGLVRPAQGDHKRKEPESAAGPLPAHFLLNGSRNSNDVYDRLGAFERP